MARRRPMSELDAAKWRILKLEAANTGMRHALQLVDEFGKAEEADGINLIWTDQFREMIEAARNALDES